MVMQPRHLMQPSANPLSPINLLVNWGTFDRGLPAPVAVHEIDWKKLQDYHDKRTWHAYNDRQNLEKWRKQCQLVWSSFQGVEEQEMKTEIYALPVPTAALSTETERSWPPNEVALLVGRIHQTTVRGYAFRSKDVLTVWCPVSNETFLSLPTIHVGDGEWLVDEKILQSLKEKKCFYNGTIKSATQCRHWRVTVSTYVRVRTRRESLE